VIIDPQAQPKEDLSDVALGKIENQLQVIEL
jgi:hypothetical protein